MEILARQPNPRSLRTDAELESIFGLALKSYLESATTMLPTIYDEVHTRLDSAINALHDALTRNLRNHDFQVPHLASSVAVGTPPIPTSTPPVPMPTQMP
jgi:hypothetical protein